MLKPDDLARQTYAHRVGYQHDEPRPPLVLDERHAIDMPTRGARYGIPLAMRMLGVAGAVFCAVYVVVLVVL